MINIQDIIPFMKKGWVAMDSNGSWFWYDGRPKIDRGGLWVCNNRLKIRKAENISAIFDIAPADDWTKSLIRVKGVKTK